MDDLGKWGKASANHPANVAKPLVDRIVEGIRDDKMASFLSGLQTGWGRRELHALTAPLPPRPQIRVMSVRHGMGHHNDMGGGLSLFNRDASLNKVGKAQAEAVGAVLAASTHFEKLDLVVVSPFRRTLETAAHMLAAAPNRGHDIRTVVHPLAAEHTLLRSGLQQGDRGSTAAQLRELFPSAEYPQYDFDEIDRYCAQHGLEDGKWWHHRPADGSDLIDAVMPHETQESFGERAEEFRGWLGREAGRSGCRTVMVISHGGLLTAAFGGPQYHNCEFRLHDLMPSDGTAVRVSPVSDTETPTILRQESRRIGEGEDEVTYYVVRFGLVGPELSKRYSDFLSLKRALKVAGKERHKALFPGKAHGAVMGIAGAELEGVMESRAQRLEEWLRVVVHQHSIHDEAIADWAAAPWDGGATPLPDDAGWEVLGAEPEPEPEPDGVGTTAQTVTPSILGTVKRADPEEHSRREVLYYIVSVVEADEHGRSGQSAQVERRYNDFLSLKRKLKAAEMEGFSDVFPKKYEANRHRQTALEGWLRRVVRTHSMYDPRVAEFLMPREGVVDSPLRSAADVLAEAEAERQRSAAAAAAAAVERSRAAALAREHAAVEAQIDKLSPRTRARGAV